MCLYEITIYIIYIIYKTQYIVQTPIDKTNVRDYNIDE